MTVETMEALESIGWLIDAGLVLLSVLFLLLGRIGWPRVATVGLAGTLYVVSVSVAVWLTTVVLPPTPGPVVLSWQALSIHAVVFTLCWAPFILALPMALGSARRWWTRALTKCL